MNWLRASAHGRRHAARAATQRRRAAAQGVRQRASASRLVTIPYQRTIPHNLPVVDASLDIVSPPLTCLDQGTIWSQPGNLYSQIVDLADVDNSRSMMRAGQRRGCRGPFPHEPDGHLGQGTTHPAPLSRDKIEAITVTRTTLKARRLRRPDLPHPSAR